jgi:hypothetical protein
MGNLLLLLTVLEVADLIDALGVTKSSSKAKISELFANLDAPDSSSKIADYVAELLPILNTFSKEALKDAARSSRTT